MFVRKKRAGGMLIAVAIAMGTVGVAQVGTSGASARPLSRAELHNAAGDHLGSVVFLGRGRHATQLRVELALPLSAPGINDFHGLHVHANGVCHPPFTSAGGHWDDGTHAHGAHLGDLPSVLVGRDGRAALTADIPRFDVADLAGRSVILHEGRDNFGNVPVGPGAGQYAPNSESATALTAGTGNAGPRYGCGVLQPAGS